MSLEHAILGFLSERPRSGYDLKTRCFDGPSAGFWTADQAQVYRTLDRLAKGKAVRSRRIRQAGRPDRRLFELTPLGSEQLDAWLAEPHELPQSRDPFLLQLWFASRLEDVQLEALLSDARSAHQERLDALRAEWAQTAQDTSQDGRTVRVRQIALEGAIAVERSTIDWLDDALEEVRRRLPDSGSPVEGKSRRRSRH